MAQLGGGIGNRTRAASTQTSRVVGKLTALEAKRLAQRSEHLLINDGGGLYLQVTPRGASWIFRYRLSREKVRDMGLGPFHTLSLAEAREKARDCRKLRLDGKDPIEERRRQRRQSALAAATALTFKEAATRYIASQSPGWKNLIHAKQWPSTLEAYVYPVFGDLPVEAIDVGLVLKAVEPIWTTKSETASRVRGRIEGVLDWATARGYRTGDNPARWRGHLENLLPKRSKVRRVEHHAALPYAEIGEFMTVLRQEEGIAARALEFAILTAARTGEVIGARWNEFNLTDRVWTVPAERMKAGKDHRVPLSDAAFRLIEAMATVRDGNVVFPGGKPGPGLSNMAMLKLLRRMKRDDLTVHGFRSTFRDWCAERTNFPAEVAEMALAHTVSDKVEAAYRRGTMFAKRRQLADAWAKYCATTMATEVKVIAIGAR